MGLRGCCGCFSLRDGSVAVGIVFVVLSSLGVVATIGLSIYLAAVQDRLQPGVYSSAQGENGIGIACGVLHLVFSALLVHGAKVDNRGMVLAWLIYFGIAHGLQSLATVIMLIFSFISGSGMFIVIMLLVAAVAGVFWYWFCVVLFHYQEMKQSGFVYQMHSDPAAEAERQ